MHQLRRTRGFTLIELLVAIAIVGVLAAMAVPALRSAMDSADRSVCLSNLRQLGQAFSQYNTDHGNYPAAEEEILDAAGTVVERKRWYHALGPYLDSTARAWSSGQGRAVIDPVTRLATATVLPADDDTDQGVMSPVLRCPSVKHWEIGRNCSYGYNHQYFGDARSAGTATDGTPLYRLYPVRPTMITDRTRTVLLTDSAGTGVGEYRPGRTPDSGAIGNHAFTVDPPLLPERGPVGALDRLGSDGVVAGVGSPTLPSRPHDRHRGGCCVLFADGRVEWIALTKLMDNDAFWNGTGLATP